MASSAPAPLTGTITFTVRGIPAPQGSKRAFRNKYSGRIQQVESSKRVAPWRSDVRDAALSAVGWAEPMSGPVYVELVFRLPRPRNHYGSGRNAGVLKPSAPIWPAGKPDRDKLERAVMDALSGLVFVDDAQVVSGPIEKRYADGDGPGVTVTVVDLSTAKDARP
jgi:Holliday junction resolvase RusA-like endonuclease